MTQRPNEIDATSQFAQSQIDQIDPICDRFEHAWRTGQRPRIEDYLSQAPPEIGASLFRELLLVEWAYRQVDHSAWTLPEYLARFPDRATEIEQAYRAECSTGAAAHDGAVARGAVAQGVDLTGSYTPAGDTQPSANRQRPPTIELIGKYRVVETLGSGGQAEVYRALHPHLPGRDVVIKLAHAELATVAQEQLLEEGRILAGLEHPGLVRVFDVDLHEGRPYVVFEYVKGQSLRDYLRSHKFEPAQALPIMLRLAETLAVVQQQGVLHRDLKPANILLDDALQPRILDFGLGLSSTLWTADESPRTGMSGTLTYMAPEQACDDAAAIGPWSDIFGLGGICYEMLTGTAPRQFATGATFDECLRSIDTSRCTPLRQLNTHIPAALEAIVERMLAADVAARYSSAAEVVSALRAYQQRGARRRLLLTATASVVLAAGIGGWWFTLAVNQDHAPITAPVPLSGELQVRVWSGNDQGTKRGWGVNEPRALPVRNGEMVHVEATLNQDAYLYVLWIDSEGKVTRLDAPQTTDHEVKPRRELHSPARLDEGWDVIGESGLETVVLLASIQLLDPNMDVAKLIDKFPATRLTDPREFAAISVEPSGRPGDAAVVRVTGQTRGIGSSHTIDDPLLKLLQSLRDRFDLVKAVRFAHEQ